MIENPARAIVRDVLISELRRQFAAAVVHRLPDGRHAVVVEPAQFRQLVARLNEYDALPAFLPSQR